MFADRRFVMTDMANPLNPAVSDGFSDETIRRFLLGSLSASEQTLFEQRLMSEVGLDARARLIELDLADDYAYGRLTTSERKLFVQRFLVTADRQRKVRVSELLHDRFSFAGAMELAARPEADRGAKRFWHFFGLDRRPWRIAFGALILLILFGTVLLIVKEPRLAERVTKKIIPRRSTLPSAPREVNHPTNVSSPEHPSTPSPMPPHDSATLSPQTVALFPTAPNTAGKIPAVTLTSGDKDVLRLRLVVTVNPTTPYRAEVLTIAGQSILLVDRLQGPQFDVDVPMRLLKGGKYQVRLSDARDGSKKEVASYYFLVQ
jgi:hypothetical protein